MNNLGSLMENISVSALYAVILLGLTGFLKRLILKNDISNILNLIAPAHLFNPFFLVIFIAATASIFLLNRYLTENLNQVEEKAKYLKKGFFLVTPVTASYFTIYTALHLRGFFTTRGIIEYSMTPVTYVLASTAILATLFFILNYSAYREIRSTAEKKKLKLTLFLTLNILNLVSSGIISIFVLIYSAA